MTAPYADLIERLRDPHFQGAMQYLRGWTDLDDMHDDAAKAIEALQADLETRTREYACAAERADDEAGRSLAYLGEIEALQAEVERLETMGRRLIDWIENEVGAELPFTDSEADLLATAAALITSSAKGVTDD